MICKKFVLLLTIIFFLLPSFLFSQDALSVVKNVNFGVDEIARFISHNIWMLLSTFLVFIMHLGFSVLEVGLTRARNTVNILFKNFLILAIGIISYALIGFNLMYPDFSSNFIIEGFLGFAGFGISVPEGASGLIEYADGKYTYLTDFLFQGMFAATAATIISGAVAERIKLWPFIIAVVIYVAFIYPIIGSWHWGQGWLYNLGFYDFAGSTIVHSVGGWAALIAVILLGLRMGKYTSDGRVKPILGHSMPLATIGVFLLWFGFNGGSVLSAEPGIISLVLVNTTLSAAAGIIGSTIASTAISKGKPDLSMVLNGSLAGLVGITAGADTFSIMSALTIGMLAGILVVLSVVAFDKMKLDDPVGAISVHLICGIWGTLAVGIFSVNSEHTFINQLIGVFAVGFFSCIASFLIFGLIKLIMGIRVSREDEIKGLDISEHGIESYSGFQIFTSE